MGKKAAPDDFISVVLAKRIDPKKPLPLDTLLTMMRNKLAELKVKPGAVVKLVEQPWTVRSDRHRADYPLVGPHSPYGDGEVIKQKEGEPWRKISI